MSGTEDRDPRRLLLDLYQAALLAVAGDTCVVRALRDRPVHGPVRVIAIGKAAAAMWRGASLVLGKQIQRALLITKRGHADGIVSSASCQVIEAGHPVPDTASLAAGEALLALIADTPADTQFLFLISGGASSLVEVPVAGVTLEMLTEASASLLASGLDIHAMNQVRTALSRIKGGQLLSYLEGRRARALLISDVPGDDPAVIGSGLLVPGIACGPAHLTGLPDGLRELCRQRPDVPAAAHADVTIVASNADALRAVLARAQLLGLAAQLHPRGLQGDAHDQGAEIARMLLDAEPGVHVWGGETVMTLPAQPGRGGRNQALALAAAIELQGRDEIWLLAAGTDGSDGPTEDAGALVDGGTSGRGALAGLDARDCLKAADSGRFLEASGDLIQTGPTGTNVMDLVIALRGELASSRP